MELDSKISTPKNEINSKKNPRVCYRWDNVEDRLRIHLALGGNRTRKQANSRTSFAKKSKERNMFVAERYLSDIVTVYGKHPVSTDGGTWYPMACRFLKLKHHIHSTYEKSIIERTMQYIKDRTESFDDYFPCRQKNCKLKHVRNWMNMFVEYHNKEVKHANWTQPIKSLNIRKSTIFE